MSARPARIRAGAVVAVLAAPATLLAACADAVPRPMPVVQEAERPLAGYDPEAERPAVAAVLALVPAAAAVVSVSDLDAARADLGRPDLTSEDSATDRADFWRRVREESVLLAEGRLRAEDSRLLLDYGFTSDDVDWEAAWTGPDGAGWALGLRPDLDLAGVRRAVADGVPGLEGARVDGERRIVHRGAVVGGAETWGERRGVRDLVPDGEATAALYRDGCVPLREAIGPDAGGEEQERVVKVVDPTTLEPLEGWSIAFDDGLATVRLGHDRGDVFDRSALTAGWPLDGFGRVFGDPLDDPSTGRIGMPVRRLLEAVGLTLGGVAPYAVCDEVPPIEEPTGL